MRAALSGREACDVVVIGGGITGALVSYRLVQSGLSVILLEGKTIAGGSTAASTGLLQYEVDTHLADLARQVGLARAVGAYRCGMMAVQDIEQIVRKEKLQCGFSRRSSIYFASQASDLPALREEFMLRREHGVPVRLINHAQLRAMSSIDAPAALYSAGHGQIDPYHFTLQLFDRSVAHGLKIYENSPIASLALRGSDPVVETTAGSAQARYIIFATGYQSEKFLSFRVGRLHSTYAVASEPLKSTAGWPACGSLIWETARPYFYGRLTDDRRVLFGGEDTPYSQDHIDDEILLTKADALVRRCRSIFPELDLAPEFAWGGVFGETPDGLARIGPDPAAPRHLFALGYGGNGITYSQIAARILTDYCLGKENSAAEIFTLSGVDSNAGPEPRARYSGPRSASLEQSYLERGASRSSSESSSSSSSSSLLLSNSS